MKNDPIAKHMVCLKPWAITVGITPVLICVDQRVTVETLDFEKETARIHIGGMLRTEVPTAELNEYTRIATPEELHSELNACPHCDRLELQPSKWMKRPPCFRPREGVELVNKICPDCDDQ